MKPLTSFCATFVLLLVGCNDCSDRCCEAAPASKPAAPAPAEGTRDEHDSTAAALQELHEELSRNPEKRREILLAWVKRHPKKVPDLLRSRGWQHPFNYGPPEDAPRIKATILAAKPEIGIVILSVGTNNRVMPGHRFIISRGDQYVGTVQVDKVYADMCSTKVVIASKDQSVRVGDQAATPQD